jgi:hypothetical protein
MAVPESPIPSVSLNQLVHATRQQTVATMAAAIIGGSGRPCSIGEVLALMDDITFAMFPTPGLGTYEQWKSIRAEKLTKVHI